MHRRLFTVVVAVLFLATPALPAPAAPPAPEQLPDLPGPFHPYNVTGKDQHRGTYHCLVSERGLDPVVLVFVRGNEPTDAVKKLLAGLDEVVGKNQKARLGGVVVFLSDDLADVVKDNDKRDALAPKLLDATGDFKQVAVGLDSYAPIKALYKLADEAEITVVVYNKLKVLGTRTFPKDGLNDDGVKAVLDLVNEKLLASPK